MGLTVQELSKKYGATYSPPTASLSGGSIVSPYQSLAQKYGAVYNPPIVQEKPSIFQGTKQGISDIIADPLTLKADPKKAVGNAWEAVKGSVLEEGTRIKDFFNSFGRTPGVSEEIGTGLKAVSGAVGVVFSPISALFAGAEQIPVLGTVAKVVNLPFTAVGEGLTEISGGIVDKLPISQTAKDYIKPGIQEIAALAGQILLGKAVGSAKKVKLVEKYGKLDANTIIKEATKLAEQKKAEVLPEKKTTAEQIATQYGGEVKPKAEWDKVKPTTEPIKPQGEAVLNEIKPTSEISGIAKQIEAKAIEQGMIDKGFSELAEYDSSTIKKQSELGAKYTPEQLKEIAKTGELPDGMKPATPLSILEDYAVKNKDVELMTELAKSPLNSRISASASEVSLSRMREKMGTVENIREVERLREEGVKDVKPNELNKVKEVVRKSKPTKDAWLNFIESLKCPKVH